MVDEEGRPHITDFGLAKRLETDVAGVTQSGAIVGTPSYMAPEQAAAGAGKPVTASADIYSLGAILYEMLTGRPPFRAGSVMETVMQVLEHEPIPPRRVPPEAPRDLELICLKCLDKDPLHRYPTALALAEDLERYLRDEDVEARRTGFVQRVTRWRGESRSSRSASPAWA